MGRLVHKRREPKQWCQVCGEVSGTCSHTRPGCSTCGDTTGFCIHARPERPSLLNDNFGNLGQPELVGRMPVRSDIEVLPADEPQQIRLGWTVNEMVGVAVANSRGVSRLSIDPEDPRPTRGDTILETIRHSLSQFLIEGILINTLNVSRHTYLRIQEAASGMSQGELVSMYGINLRVSQTPLDNQLLFAEERTSRATTFYPVEI